MGSKFIYPYLADYGHDFGFFRMGGPGLANCMFVATRAYSYAKRYDAQLIAPTWFNVAIGPYLRREKDKRHYLGLFKSYGISGVKKLWLINRVTHTEADIKSFAEAREGVLKVNTLGRYFQDINPQDAKEYFDKTISDSIKKTVDKEDFCRKIAIHVRLGDYVKAAPECVTPISWFRKIIDEMYKVNPDLEFCVFSDGTDEQLKDLLTMPNTTRVYYGSALADMYAISKCQLVIASHSTFSAWGAFMGNKPVIFEQCDFAPIYNDGTQLEYIIPELTSLPEGIISILKNVQ